MNETLKILILEDDREERDNLSKSAQTIKNIEIVGNTASATDALSIAKSTSPHAIIVDLELHNGSGNGLQFLSELKNIPTKTKPFLLVTTNNSSRTTHDAARAFGADFILTKYEATYSAEYVLNFLTMMHSTIHGASSDTTSFAQQMSENKISVHNISEAEFAAFIRDELLDIGINPKSVGFNYLTDSVLVKLKDANANIYKEIAPKYKKSDSSIERAMQYAINCAWRSGDPEELLEKYTARINSERGVPTIMEFIYFYVSKAQNNFNIK